MKKRIPLAELISIEILAEFVLLLSSLFIFIFIAHEIFAENETAFDNHIFHFFSSFTTSGLISVMEFFTFFGTIKFLLPAYIIVILYFLFKKQYFNAIHIGVIGVTTTALLFILKAYFHRSRPPLPILKGLKTYSFPSGHALCTFVFCTTLVYFIQKSKLPKAWKFLISFFLISFSLIVGISRVILKVHYPSDVLAGFCLGIFWVFASFRIFSFIKSSFKPKPVM